jgi:hypothetical protein
MAPKHQAPSRARYAAAHPARTVRFKPETHAKIVAICERTGLSYNQAVNSAVAGLDDAAIGVILARGEELGLQKGAKAARVEARAAGFAEAANVFRITVPCQGCSEPIEVRLDDSTASIAIRALIDAGFGHTACRRAPDRRGALGGF